VAINVRNLINSSFGVNTALWIGRTTPNKIGKRLARVAGEWIASHRDWEMVRAVRANRWVVSGETLAGAELDQAVQATFRHTADSLFTLYHHFQNLEAMQRLVIIDELSHKILFRPKFEERGVVIVGLHLGNFDMVLQTAGLMGLDAFVMTLPELPGGYKLQFDFRRRTGINLVPASMSSMRQAIEYLHAGGMVVTGMDRPEAEFSYRPMFFNHPSALPVHHVVLAIKAQVPIRIGFSQLRADGRYYLTFSEPIEMQPHADRKQEILMNAEAVLKVAEGYISQTPEQWEMTFPVWPEALARV
jgi:lauroyl/myristoyl acyltransferase